MSQPSRTGVADPVEANRLVERALSRGVRFINLEFTDLLGLPKCVTIPADQLPDCLANGKWFDGSSSEGFARVVETDMYLRPDLSTYAETPFRGVGAAEESAGAPPLVARLICDVLLPGGEPFQGDPRAALIAALDEAAALGYRYEVAAELEFFLLRDVPGTPVGAPLPHDRGGYFDLSTDLAAEVRRESVAELARMGSRIEASHHEVAAGQHEIDFAATDALRSADSIVTARYVVKAIAARHGLRATFLPKPFYGVNGSGMHSHQRLMWIATGAEAFAAPDDADYGLAPTGRHFIAGQLEHAPGMSAVVAPLVNSYKRLVRGFEAPVMITWGRVNREALVRVPRLAPGDPTGVRVELRSPDPSCNPYLAFAVMLRAGLDGIRRQLPLEAPVEEDLVAPDEAELLTRGISLLPATLGEALAAFERDDVAQGALGAQIAGWLTEVKRQEWREYQSQVSPWEIAHYLPLF
jgi:glutamine synthetase